MTVFYNLGHEPTEVHKKIVKKYCALSKGKVDYIELYPGYIIGYDEQDRDLEERYYDSQTGRFIEKPNGDILSDFPYFCELHDVRKG